MLRPISRVSPVPRETWAADLVSEAISTRVGLFLSFRTPKATPSSTVMSMRISDGTVFELKLPQPDYEIKVELSGFRKVKFSEVQGGASSFVYGAYAQMHIEEPLSRKAYLSTALKNGETRADSGQPAPCRRLSSLLRRGERIVREIGTGDGWQG